MFYNGNLLNYCEAQGKDILGLDMYFKVFFEIFGCFGNVLICQGYSQVLLDNWEYLRVFWAILKYLGYFQIILSIYEYFQVFYDISDILIVFYGTFYHLGKYWDILHSTGYY